MALHKTAHCVIQFWIEVGVNSYWTPYPYNKLVPRYWHTPWWYDNYKVIPTYKSSDPTLLKHYRPISILPKCSKLLEKIMYDKLMSFFSLGKIFSINTNMVFGQSIQPSTLLPIFLIAVPKPTTKQILNIHCSSLWSFQSFWRYW